MLKAIPRITRPAGRQQTRLALDTAAANLESMRVGVHRGTRAECEQRYVDDFIAFQ
jgi:hypothetical protein